MKRLLNFFCLAALFCVCNIFTSCEDGGWQSAFNDTKYVGEWRPVRYATTYNDEVITDEDQLYKEWYLGWFILSQNSFRSATSMVEGSYVAKDDNITFYYDGYGGKHKDAYDVISYNNDELLLIDSDSHTEIVTLEKFHERSLNTQDIVGKWRASKMITFFKNGNKSSGFTERLNGFEYINITNTQIKLMGKNRTCSYYIDNNNLYTTPILNEFSFASAHIKDVKNDKLYIYYVSQDGQSEMYVTYRLIEDY